MSKVHRLLCAVVVGVVIATPAALLINPAASSAASNAPAGVSKSVNSPLPRAVVRPLVRANGKLPVKGDRPPVVSQAAGAQINGNKSSTPPAAPVPVTPAVGTAKHSSFAPSGAKAKAINPAGDGHSPGRLLWPTPGAARAQHNTPATFYGSTLVDTLNDNCGAGTNESNVAQSTADPNTVVVVAQSYHSSTGACADSNAWIFTSKDGGQHWTQQIAPGINQATSGDTTVVYDRLHNVFIMSYLDINRSDGTQGDVTTIRSFDGLSWGTIVRIDTNNATYGVDKEWLSTDTNPSSAHYGRTNVAWTQFHGNASVYRNAYSDNGGVNWTFGNVQINFPSHSCGNGLSTGVDASGELMAAWWDCTGGVAQILAEFSPDGGATWPESTDEVIRGSFASIEDPTSLACSLNGGGTAFRCNSFPSMAGDPTTNGSAHAFAVHWAEQVSVTQGSVTHNISLIEGRSTLSAATNATSWDGVDQGTFTEFGDKFFPASAFSSTGRFYLLYLNRSIDATTSNPQGHNWFESGTDGTSINSLRGGGGFVTFTADATQSNPGTSGFIGDYTGVTFSDLGYDALATWMDDRTGVNQTFVQDLCYINCYSNLSPNAPLSIGRASGSVFTDRWRINTNAAYGGSGADFWNAVGIRNGTADNDMTLDNRYGTSFAGSGSSPPINDYVLENDNTGHAPRGPWYPEVHSFSTIGGSYSVEWAAGTIVEGDALSGSMASANVVRVYDTLLSTGTLYRIGLRPTAGNTSGYSLGLHSATTAAEQGRSSAVADSGNVAAGSPAFVAFNTGSDPTQYDGVVVMNNNGGSGSYTLYRDTTTPTGTVSVNGGATYTTSTAVTLTLSATNPNANDPVYDMRISTDGGTTFGPFIHYATSASATLPAGDGTKTVVVQFRNGSGAISANASDTIILAPTPTVTAVNPHAGPLAGGQTVIISGTHFTGTTAVKFGTAAATSVTVVNANTLTAHTPAHAAGVVDVRVTTHGGTSGIVSADHYTYEAAPTITAVNPHAGPLAGGQTVIISGTNFTGTTGVKFGTAAATSVTFVNANTLTAHTPAHAAGLVDVRVTTPSGTSAVVAADHYTYEAAPTVTAVSPLSGSHLGGQTVTISGTNFTGATAVKFGTTAATSVTVVNATTITAHAPAHATGLVDVRVTTPSGTSAIVAADHYTYT